MPSPFFGRSILALWIVTFLLALLTRDRVPIFFFLIASSVGALYIMAALDADGPIRAPGDRPFAAAAAALPPMPEASTQSILPDHLQIPQVLDTEDNSLLYQSTPMAFIDTTGAVVVHIGDANTSDCCEGLIVRQPFGIVDQQGTLIARQPTGLPNPPNASWDIFIMSGFQDGLAIIQDTRNQRYGFVDRHGQAVIPPRFIEVGPFSNERAPAMDADDRSWGYLDPEGRWSIPPAALRSTAPPRTFTACRAAVRNTRGDWGYLDPNGELAIPFGFSDAQDFAEGRAWVRAPQGWMLINPDGTVIRHPDAQLLSVRPCSGGLAAVQWNTGFWGFLHPDGTIAIPGRFAEVQRFAEGLCWVRPSPTDRWMLIDVEGQTRLEGPVDRPSPFFGGRALVTLEGESAYITPDGRRAFPTRDRFARMWPFAGGLARVELVRSRDQESWGGLVHSDSC